MSLEVIQTGTYKNEQQLINSFLIDCKIRNYSPRTIASYKSHIKYFLSLNSVFIDANDLKRFLVLLRDERGLAASTVEGYFSSLTCFYDFLEWEGIISENIVPKFRKRYIRYYKEPRHEERQLINLEQMKALIDSAEDLQTKCIFLLFAKTGIRRQELIDIDRSDVYPKKNMIILKAHHFKRSNRTIFYDDECGYYLEKWIKWRYNHGIKKKALFLGIQGGRISRDLVYDLTTNHAEPLGFHDPKGQLHEKFTPHCFRHFFTTWLRRAGCPREYVQELRGDSRTEAIDIYHHITQDELREAYMQYVPQLGIEI